MKMRQAFLVARHRFEIREEDISLPADHVLVEMSGCGLCTWELNHWGGSYGALPTTLGHEGWGRVVEVGKATSSGIKVGDLVTGLGWGHFADFFTLAEKDVMRITNPRQKDVPGEPLCCVQNVIRAAHPEVADTVVVIGAGPMGQWVIQGLAAAQLGHLVVFDLDETKLSLARKHGATATINPSKGDPVAMLKELTGGRLADVAIEGTGSAIGFQMAVDLLRVCRAKLVVMSSFKSKIEVDIPKMCEKAIDVIHAHPSISRDVADGVRRTEILINKGVLTTDGLISHRFKLEDIEQAFRAMENRPAGYLKGIVTR